jgi:spermidine synthase
MTPIEEDGSMLRRISAPSHLRLALSLVAMSWSTLLAVAQEAGPIVELQETSNYSRVKVTREPGTRHRTLWFVRDNGQAVIESSVDLERPDDLRIEYTRFMFLSYAFRPEPKRALIVGLGGGAMVHFLKVHDPGLKLDVVEIDPMIVSVADRFFEVRSGGNVDVKTADGLAYLKQPGAKYDVIYMDAFLRPSGGTDKTGVPLHLKTEAFYDQVKARLNPDGVVVFNLNPHPAIQQDIRNIRRSFRNAYAFRLQGYDGFIVVASTAEKALTRTEIEVAAGKLDERFHAPFEFGPMAARLTRN